MEPLAVIIAGGHARRMGGGDKCLLPVDGRRVLDLTLDRLSSQVSEVVINANGDPARFGGPQVIPDPRPDRPGPLAGVLAAMRLAAERGLPRVLSVPGDAPFLPLDLVARLNAAAQSGAAIAASESEDGDLRRHPTCALWPTDQADTLEAWLTSGGRRVARFAEQIGAGVAIWPETRPDPFFNINHPDDLALAERLVRA